MSETYSIWVIDDDEDVVKSLVALLNDRGHSAQGFTDVWKFFSEFTTQFPLELPHVALIDMVNHQMPGWQICEKFRAELYLQKVKLVAMSGILESADAERMKLTADAFIRKPFNIEDLEAVMNGLFADLPHRS